MTISNGQIGGGKPSYVIDSLGNTALIGPDGNILIRPVYPYLWADRPDPVANPGLVIRATDIGGSAGTLLISDGAYYKSYSGAPIVLGYGHEDVSVSATTAEEALKQVLVPAYLAGPNGIVRVTTTWTTSGNTNTKRMRIRFGASGLTGDVHMSIDHTLANQTSAQYLTSICNVNNLATQKGGSDSGHAGYGITANASITAGTQNTGIDRYITISGTKVTSSGDTLTLNRYLVELLTL